MSIITRIQNCGLQAKCGDGVVSSIGYKEAVLIRELMIERCCSSVDWIADDDPDDFRELVKQTLRSIE